MARRAHRSSILSSSRTPDQLRVPRSEHLVHFSRRRCFEHNQRPEHLTCRRPRLDVARRAHPWPGTWCTYRRAQYERYSLAVTSDGKVGPSGVVLRPLSHCKCDNVFPPPFCGARRRPGPGAGAERRRPARACGGRSAFTPRCGRARKGGKPWVVSGGENPAALARAGRPSGGARRRSGAHSCPRARHQQRCGRN